MTAEPPLVSWNYLPLTHVRHAGGAYFLTLVDDREDAPVRIKVEAPEDAQLLQPYLDLHRLEQQNPWANSPAYVPVSRTADSRWTFSPAGARYDLQLLDGFDRFRKLSALTEDSESEASQGFPPKAQLSPIDTPSKT